MVSRRVAESTDGDLSSLIAVEKVASTQRAGPSLEYHREAQAAWDRERSEADRLSGAPPSPVKIHENGASDDLAEHP
jgi:hypothetical protein